MCSLCEVLNFRWYIFTVHLIYVHVVWCLFSAWYFSVLNAALVMVFLVLLAYCKAGTLQVNIATVLS